MSRHRAVRSFRRPIRALLEACEQRRLLCGSFAAASHGDVPHLDLDQQQLKLYEEASRQKPTNSRGPALLLTVPALSSRPTAPLSLYLDFDGEGSNLPFDMDDDPANFSSGELAAIQESWRQVTQYFSPFDVNVTTVKPAPTDNFAWNLISDSVYNGYANLDHTINNPHPSIPAGYNQSDHAVTRNSAIAHEIGHMLGLHHQSTFTNAGTLNDEYRTDPVATRQAIMGIDFAGVSAKWQKGQAPRLGSGNMAFQDDVAIIASTVMLYAPPGSDGFIPDDHVGSLSSPTALTVGSNGAATASGNIERLGDADIFSFTVASARTRIEVNPQWPSGVDLRATVYNSSGTIVIGLDGKTSLDQQTIAALPAGTYRIAVESSGNIGDIGSYTVSVSPFAADWEHSRLQPGRGGSVRYDAVNQAFHLEGVGSAQYYESADNEFLHQRLSGDGSIIVRATLDPTSVDGLLGIAMRSSLAPDAPKVQLLMSTPNLTGQFGVRTSAQPGLTSTSAGPNPATGTPVWLKLTRTGNNFSAFSSPDGVTWTQVGSTTAVSMGTDIYAGAVASSSRVTGNPRGSNLSDFAKGTVDNITLTGISNPIPPVYAPHAGPSSVSTYASYDSNVILSWASVSGATAYSVEYSPDGVNYTSLITLPNNYYFHYPDHGAVRQFYRVRAVVGGLVGQATTVSFVNGPAAPISAQAQLTQASGKVVVTWEDAFGESGYSIARSNNGGVSYTNIATLPANTVTYLDQSAVGGVDYLYRVFATGASTSNPTTTNSIHLRLNAPANLTFTRNSTVTGTLDWSAVPNAASYTVERSSDAGITWTTISSGSSNLYAFDFARQDLVAYRYRVTAVESSSAAGFATVINVLTADPAKPVSSPWSLANVGGNALETGVAEHNSGTFTIASTVRNSIFSEIASTFVYQTLSGDGSITARLTARPTNSTDASGYHAGIMIANDLTAGGAKMSIGLSLAGVFTFRNTIATDNGSRSSQYITLTGAPVWYRLTRAGTTVSAEISSDGVTWTSAGSSTVALGTNAYVGFFTTSAASSSSNGQPPSTKAIFDNVTVYDSSPMMTPPSMAGKTEVKAPSRRGSVWSELAIIDS